MTKAEKYTRTQAQLQAIASRMLTILIRPEYNVKPSTKDWGWTKLDCVLLVGLAEKELEDERKSHERADLP